MKVKRLHDQAILPRRAHTSDSGLDLYACEATTLEPGQQTLVQHGIAIEIPYGYEGQIRPRSSTAFRGLQVQFGTIDQGYRGGLATSVVNRTPLPIEIRRGERISQLVVAPVLLVDVEEVNDMSDTPRGDSGWGSTGVAS